MRVRGLDHIVLVVSDPVRSVRWYCDELGLGPERLEEFLAGEVFFPSARVDATTIIDFIGGEPTGRTHDHVCLVVDDDPAEILEAGRLDVVEGPAPRWGAQGDALSIYVRDPDGHIIELRRYQHPRGA